MLAPIRDCIWPAAASLGMPFVRDDPSSFTLPKDHGLFPKTAPVSMKSPLFSMKSIAFGVFWTELGLIWTETHVQRRERNRKLLRRRLKRLDLAPLHAVRGGLVSRADSTSSGHTRRRRAVPRGAAAPELPLPRCLRHPPAASAGSTCRYAAALYTCRRLIDLSLITGTNGRRQWARPAHRRRRKPSQSDDLCRRLRPR